LRIAAWARWSGENPEEIRVFVDSILKGGIYYHPSLSQDMKERRFGPAILQSSLVKGTNYTADTGRWQDRKWEAIPANLASDRVTGLLPAGTRVFYFNLFDERSCVGEHRAPGKPDTLTEHK
jgi:hypothetical protein